MSQFQFLLRSSRSSHLFVFKVIGSNEFEHGVTKQKRVFAVIETPRHFVEVGRQMLCGNTMPRTDNAALEQRVVGSIRDASPANVSTASKRRRQA